MNQTPLSEHHSPPKKHRAGFETLVVIDCETGGLDPHRNALLEIAAIPMIYDPVTRFFRRSDVYDPFYRFATARTLRERLLCLGTIDAEASAVNGWPPCRFPWHDRIHPTILESSPGLSEQSLISLFADYMRTLTGGFSTKPVFVGMNPAFDVGFIQPRWERWVPFFPWPFQRRIFDLQGAARSWAYRYGRPLRKFSADEIYKSLGRPEEPKPHNAMTGARLAAEAINALVS